MEQVFSNVLKLKAKGLIPYLIRSIMTKLLNLSMLKKVFKVKDLTNMKVN